MSSYESQRTARATLREFWAIEAENFEVVRIVNNAVARVSSGQGTFALRQHRSGYRQPDQIKSELEFVNAWGSGSSTRLAAVPTRQGDLVAVDASGASWSLLGWLPGKALQPGRGAGIATLARMGEELARLHDFSCAFRPSAIFQRPTTVTLDEPTVWRGHDRLDVPDQETLSAAAARMSSVLEVWARRGGEPRLIHNDPVLINWLHHRRTSSLIDFDDCGWGYFEIDIGCILENLQGVRTERQLWAAFVSGYEAIRPLPIKSRAEAADAIVWRHVVSMRWTLELRDAGALDEEKFQRICSYRLRSLRSVIGT